jgi:hypothetical protein
MKCPKRTPTEPDVTGTEAGATGPARSECLKGDGTGGIVVRIPSPCPAPKGRGECKMAPNGALSLWERAGVRAIEQHKPSLVVARLWPSKAYLREEKK